MISTLRRAHCLLILLASAIPATSLATGRTPLVQSVDIQVPVSPVPVRIAGRQHLAYELHITNLRPVEVALARLEVLDADRGTRLADYGEAELTRRLGRPGAQADLADKRVIGGGLRAVIYLWMPLPEGAAIPASLVHTIGFDVIRSTGREHATVQGVTTRVRNEPALVLTAPLRGGPWAAVYDPQMVGGHRTSIYTINGRARIPARYAIDWIRLDEDASRAHGDTSRIANWHGYGAEVLAVADGVVAEANDDIAEDPAIAAAQAPIPLENASGNYVTLDVGSGRFVFYEHLKHGSIKVQRGERVKSGQVIGQLGNSGSSSSGPHLHFHVADANATLAAEGLPYVFGSFEVIGGYDTIEGYASGKRWQPVPEGASGARKLELPAANTVVMFGSGEHAAQR